VSFNRSCVGLRAQRRRAKSPALSAASKKNGKPLRKMLQYCNRGAPDRTVSLRKKLHSRSDCPERNRSPCGWTDFGNCESVCLQVFAVPELLLQSPSDFGAPAGLAQLSPFSFRRSLSSILHCGFRKTCSSIVRIGVPVFGRTVRHGTS
jgi:hypothetical protein